MILGLLAFLFIQNMINLNLKEVDQKQIEVKQIKLLDNNGEGFYDTIEIGITEDRHIVVYDKGNFRVHIYSDQGEKRFEFGNEGSGPKALSNAKFFVIKNYILFRKFSHGLLFKLNGELLSEFKIYNTNKAQVVVLEHGFRLIFETVNTDGIKFSDYTFDGQLIRHHTQDKNIDLNIPIEFEDRFFYDLQSEFLNKKSYLSLNGKSIISAHKGAFKLDVFDSDFNIKSTYTANFNRVRMDESDHQIQMISKGQRDLRLEKLYQVAYEKLDQGYFSDIYRFNGVEQSGFYLTLESKHRNNRKTVFFNSKIQPQFQFHFFEQDLETFIIYQNIMLARYKNDDNGPFAKLYRISFN